MASLEGLAELTAALVAIDSVNPTLVPGGAGEGEIAAFVAGWARDAGLEADVLEQTPGRPSVVVRAPGSGGGRTLLLCGHLDTVGVEGMADPHSPRVDGDRLHGRGAYDMKAGVAAALVACREAASRGLAGDVVVAAVADEEHASLGVQEVLRSVEADGAVVTEPTELEVVVAHKGFVWCEVEVTGRAAHGSRPHLGVDAIVKAGPILTALGDLDEKLAERTHPLLGRGSVHASLIERRRRDVELPGALRARPGAAHAAGRDRRRRGGGAARRCSTVAGPATRSWTPSSARCWCASRSRWRRTPRSWSVVRDAAAGVLAAAPPTGGASYWADAAFIAAAGIPTVMFGPGGEGAHAVEEWVSLSDTDAVARTLVETALRFCA